MLKTGERYKELSAIFAAVREVCLVLLNFIVVWLMVVLLLTYYAGKRTGKQRLVEKCPESTICLKSCYLETAKLRAAGDLSLQT